MAQTSGNRDEPSMEDILSSIRKIIQSNEENDEGSSEKKVAEPNLAQTSAQEAPIAVNEEAPVPEASQVPEPAVKAETELVAEPVEFKEAAVPPQIKVSRPIDVAAPENASAEVQSERGELTDAPARIAQAAEQAVKTEMPVDEAPVAVAETPVANEVPTPAPTPAVEPETTQSLAAQVVASAQVAGVEHVVAALEGQLNSPKVEDAAVPTETRGSVPALISSGSGAKVAASFAELAQTLEDRAEQNLEGIASDMLRPMLQDWLDDNLPSLVEKLVREEIERVARGG